MADAEAARAQLHLPFYLYEGAAFDDGSWFAPCSRGLRGESYAEDQYSAELHFLRQLQAHRWRTRDPGAAALFVVPLYANAALQPSMRGLSCNGTHFQLLLDGSARAVARTPQYARHGGADHLLLCASWRFASKAPHQAPWAAVQHSSETFRFIFRNAIVGHMESRHASDGGFWRCSVIVPYTANFDASSAAHLLPPSSAARDVSFFFHGGANSRGTYGYAFRQAVLAQLDGLPAARLGAYSLPGQPLPCTASRATNCRAPRSSGRFRALMRRARFSLVLRGDSPSSRRLYDGLAAGALTVLVSDAAWLVALPFQCLVPWRALAFSVAEAAFAAPRGAAAALRRLAALPAASLDRVHRAATAYRRDLLWEANGSRVAENVLLTAALRCLPRHAAGGAAAAAAAALCAHADVSVACRQPDAERCAGCETGEAAAAAPLEFCCGGSCPRCNASDRCVPPAVGRGSPLLHAEERHAALERYLAAKERDLPPALQRWRKAAGRPAAAAAAAAAREGRGGRPRATRGGE
ncbi:hypothetical protein AB1Y20_008814 [Prymnesium parvum]|uniref:Exostosin GT47 domain-containing protein n=1 Tax=Prymnesium parvum TaxID=97485 RepID=A0AB34ITF8_PRYPA